MVFSIHGEGLEKNIAFSIYKGVISVHIIINFFTCVMYYPITGFVRIRKISTLLLLDGVRDWNFTFYLTRSREKIVKKLADLFIEVSVNIEVWIRRICIELSSKKDYKFSVYF